MDYYVNKQSDLPAQEIFPGIVGHLVHTPGSTIADFRIAEGTELPIHHHPHEQTSTILEGEFLFEINGVKRICRAGDVAVIPANAPHRGTAITECRIIDVFVPARDDYKLPAKEENKDGYKPIDCGLYDHLEIAIMRGSQVELVYFPEGKQDAVTVNTQLKNTRTREGEEFVQLADEQWIRLDRIVSLDGRDFHGTCGI